MNNIQQVVLLHGIFRTHHSMEGIARSLRKAGYQVHNIGYPSTRKPLEDLVEHCHTQITERMDASRPVHVVAYSMGCLITRALLVKHRPTNLGRVVMIAPPNHGSEAADWWRQWKIYRTLYGKAGQQLGTDEDAFWRQLPQQVDYPLGIIAGTRSVDPICSRVLPGANDGKVTVESTMLEGMKAHITLPVSHTFIIHRAETAQQVLAFLRHAQFDNAS